MFKTCYIFVIACLCFEFVIFGILLLLFMLCIHTILVLCIGFFKTSFISGFRMICFLDLRNEYACVYVCSYVCFNTSFLAAEFGDTNQNWQNPQLWAWWQPAMHPCGKITIARRPACERHPLTAYRAWWPSGDRCVRPVSGENERHCRHILTCVNNPYDAHQLSNNCCENPQIDNALLVFFSYPLQQNCKTSRYS
jgi:hypothetical protein